MIHLVIDYFARLARGVGQGWTRFWFTPTDPAAVCAIRLFAGMVIVYLHATLLPDLVPLFGAEGLLPSADIAPLGGDVFSYLNFLSRPAELWTVHLIGLAVLVLFAAGLWTLWTAPLSLVVFLSDVHRAPMITGRAEIVAAMVLLYLCFAPCGRRFCLQRLARKQPVPNSLSVGATAPGDLAPNSGDGDRSTLATIATRLIQVRRCLLVAMMAFSQLAGEAWWSGSGIWWLIARPESRLFDLTWLYKMPRVMDVWSHAVVLFELAFPLLIWIPLARPLMLGLGVAIWSSLALVTGETPFALMMMIASMAFVSPSILRTCCRRSCTR